MKRDVEMLVNMDRPDDECPECGMRRDEHPLAGLTLHRFGNTLAQDEAASE